MAIEYERVNWDTTKFVNPTNMNTMDKGIKDACDGVDQNSTAISEVNSNLDNKVDKETFNTIFTRYPFSNNKLSSLYYIETYKYGRVVVVVGTLLASEPINATEILGTITNNENKPMFAISTNLADGVVVHINEEGVMMLQNISAPLSVGRYYTFSATYLSKS